MTSGEFNFNECAVALGNAIRLTRQHKGMTQAELSERLGWDEAVIARIEAGKEKLSLHTVAQIAMTGLGVRFGEVGHLVDQYLMRS
ncbi:MAG TPA: helix-turn-helix transcriptional regulator [Solirubrobacterales bacterium]|nr:helix-turn-helix transcriptional regulator [Solirubrobacterales bacterium]